jgi:hypothetical protein
VEQARCDDLALAALLGAVERVVCPLEEGDRIVVGLKLGDAGRDRERAGLSDGAGRHGVLQSGVELVGVREL